jgi:hypothetical protein
VDPHYFERTFLLITDNSEKPYALLRKVLEKTGLAAIGDLALFTLITFIKFCAMARYPAIFNRLMVGLKILSCQEIMAQ